MTPIIGITTSGGNETWLQSPYYDAYYLLPALYVDAVRRAGGIPILLPPGESEIQTILSLVDGLIISGGGDIEPTQYGGNAQHPQLTRCDAVRDALEIGLIQSALKAKDRPVLCICRGMQVLNVAMGGTMYEHIPDIREVDTHRNRNGFWIVHPVEVERSSKLAQIMGATEVATYSGHHQAVKSVADGLDIVANAPDDIIEGLEAVDHPWMVGVQWHPEKSAQDDPTQQGLFDALVAAAREGIAVSNTN